MGRNSGGAAEDELSLVIRKGAKILLESIVRGATACKLSLQEVDCNQGNPPGADPGLGPFVGGRGISELTILQRNDGKQGTKRIWSVLAPGTSVAVLNIFSQTSCIISTP